MVWRDVALATVNPAKNLKVKEKRRVTYFGLLLLPLVPPRLGHEEHDGGGVRVPRCQFTIFLPSAMGVLSIQVYIITSIHPPHQPECCCGDAVNDDKDSVDDEVGQLDDTRGTSESEDEVSLRVVRVQHSHCPTVVEFLTYVAFHENKNVPSLNL